MAGSPTPVVELWQVLALLGSILLVVLGGFASLILSNRTRGQTLRQRLLGNADDETDAGFLVNTTEQLNQIEQKVDQHHETVESQLVENRQRVDKLETQANRIEFKVDRMAEVIQDQHDITIQSRWQGDKDDFRPDGSGSIEIARENHRTFRQTRDRRDGED